MYFEERALIKKLEKQWGVDLDNVELPEMTICNITIENFGENTENSIIYNFRVEMEH